MFKLPIEPKLLEVSVGTDKFFFVKVLVHKSAVFERKGLDIYTKADVSVSQALRGGQVEVRGLHDYKLMVDLPSSGVSSHQNITVDGKGIKLMDSTLVGDHHIEVGINIEELTKADDEMLKALALAHGDPQDAVQEDEADIVIPVVSGRLFKAANIDNRK
jgi:DnaJ-class molecular chaperone